MRPVYETDEQIAGEEGFARQLSKLYGAEVMRTPKFYPFDFTFVRDKKVAALVELKTRTNSMDAYPTYMLSAHKFVSARSYSHYLDLPALLYVRWSCGAIGWLNMGKSDPCKIAPGGRRDRGDAQDIEPVVHWPISAFIKI
jgi:hypothetical protein